jgi:hypothetical protein
MRKIIRKRFTIELFKSLAGRGWNKTDVEENGLPDDAQMIHLSFDEKTNCVDMFFISDSDGQIIQEGASLYGLEPTYTTFKTIDTFDKDYVKTKIDEMIKDYETDSDCDAQGYEDYIEVLQKLKERLGL